MTLVGALAELGTGLLAVGLLLLELLLPPRWLEPEQPVDHPGLATTGVSLVKVAAEPGPAMPPMPPHFTRIEVDGNPSTPGLRTRISWDAPGADSVLVDGQPGLPSSGSHEVQLTRSRKIRLQAQNAGGTVVGDTGLITFLSPPELAKISMPAGPGFAMFPTVHLVADGHSLPLRFLDHLLRSHDVTLSALAPPAPPPGMTTLASLVRLATDTSWAAGARPLSTDDKA